VDAFWEPLPLASCLTCGSKSFRSGLPSEVASDMRNTERAERRNSVAAEHADEDANESNPGQNGERPVDGDVCLETELHTFPIDTSMRELELLDAWSDERESLRLHRVQAIGGSAHAVLIENEAQF
jgi:hypothetical protein